MCCKWGNIKVKCVGEVFEKIGVRKVKYINLHLSWWCVGIIILVKWNNTNNAEIAFSYVFQNKFFGEVFQEVKYWHWHMNIQKLKVVVFWQITQLNYGHQKIHHHGSNKTRRVHHAGEDSPPPPPCRGLWQQQRLSTILILILWCARSVQNNILCCLHIGEVICLNDISTIS
jgi:hypothetical protein